MNLSVNGQSLVPPGFRFHPTEEELLHYYLPKKVANEEIDLNVIGDVDLNKLEPWDIQEKCKIGSAPQIDWYFFSHKDKKYPTGTRTNRATAAGFWKATGRDKVIKSSCSKMGMRKTLVFYRGRAPRGQKSDWIMHEYRLDENNTQVSDGGRDQSGAEEGWVVCRVFKKKSYHDKATSISDQVIINDNKTNTNTSNILDQILMHMGTPSSTINHKNPELEGIHLAPASFPHLPGLDSPNTGPAFEHADWAALDRMVASQLNGSASNIMNQDLCCSFPFDHQHDEVQLLDMKQTDDFWTFARTSSSSSSSPSVLSSSPLSHLSV